MYDRKKYGDRIRQLRIQNEYTQKELAEKVDTSPQNIDLYESGKRKILRYSEKLQMFTTFLQIIF